ncbi:MAG: hypothetical protein Cons2KO_02420 [Congregibacter sp.]
MLCVAVVGIINVLPVVGLFYPSNMTGAYGIEINTSELELLLRHRAMLFGIIGGFALISLALPQFRVSALLLAGISMLGFVLLVWGSPGISPQISRIAMIDLIGLPIVALGLAVTT